MQEVSIILFEVKRHEILTLDPEKQVLIYNNFTEEHHLATVEDIRAGNLPKHFRSALYRDYNYFFLFDNK